MDIRFRADTAVRAGGGTLLNLEMPHTKYRHRSEGWGEGGGHFVLLSSSEEVRDKICPDPQLIIPNPSQLYEFNCLVLNI